MMVYILRMQNPPRHSNTPNDYYFRIKNSRVSSQSTHKPPVSQTKMQQYIITSSSYSTGMEEFRRETNSKLKYFKDEYAKKLDGSLPSRSYRAAKTHLSTQDNNLNADLKFREFVNELFTKSSENLYQSSTVLMFCKEFGMDIDYLLGLKDFSGKQDYLVDCMNKQVGNQATLDPSQLNRPGNGRTSSKTLKNWMKLNTKHKFLETKIQEAFMQALNEEGNQEKIDVFVKDHHQRKQQEHSKSPKLKLNKLSDNDGQKIKMLSVNWDNQTEEKLKEKVNQMKDQLRDVNYMRRLGRERYITKEEYMLVAYSDIMRTLNEHKQYNMDRETILKKYMERENPLTEAEMKFILNTSPLVTKSLNKNKIKTALQNIDPQYLHSIEIRIADQVLNNFNNAIDQLKKSRKTFKKSNLNAIMSKLQCFQKSSKLDLQWAGTKTTNGTQNSDRINLIHKYSGGIQTLKRVQQNLNSKEGAKLISRQLKKKTSRQQDVNTQVQRSRKNISLMQGRDNEGCIANPVNPIIKTAQTSSEGQVPIKKKRDFTVKSLQMAAIRDNFEWVVVQNYPALTPEETNSPDKVGNTPLYYVIKNQNQQFCQYLLKNNADVNRICQKGETPLHLAFKTNNHNIIMACLMKNPDLNVVCNKGLTPLAHGKISTLKTFGLMKGVPKHKPGESKFFDNNRLLAKMEIMPTQQRAD